jgi:quercetin dioxygenase-like cupin family protein
MRQGLIRDFDPTPGVSISTLAYEYPAGFNVIEHAHGSDQIIYAPRGVMEVAADRSLWLIPPQFAVWIPAHTAHRIRMPGAVSMARFMCGEDSHPACRERARCYGSPRCSGS